ncbi:MAG TPA: hypothetical protein VIL37_14200 [Natronosporangium sp.]
MTTTAIRTRLGALSLGLAGVMFVLYPAVRPWEDESTAAGAYAAMSSGAWVASHLFAIIGFILVPLGLLALWGLVKDTRAERLALLAVVTGWVGAGLTLPYYGAEDFGLHAVATTAEQSDLLAIADEFRLHPVAATLFGGGLVALAVSGVLAAIGGWRSGILPRSAGLLFAAGLVLFLPQFFTPAAVRIAHGVLLGVGLGWLAVAMWRQASSARRSPAPPVEP